VSVSGHQRAGETLDQAIRRELSEELGVGVEAASLFHILRYRVDLRDGGRVFREFTDVLLLRDDRPIGAYIPRVAEIGALLMLPLSSGVELWAERTKITTAIEHSPDARVGRAIEIRRENFVGSKDTRYFQTVLESATAACAT
jgi:8-oxo-dGTP pyrophosphatase MutT (NUDIX family)